MSRADVKRVQVLDALETLQAQGTAELLVSQAMTTNLSCIARETTVVQLVRLFHEKAFRHLLVTGEAGQLVGVVSDRDVLRVLGPGVATADSLATITAAEVMSTDLITVASATPLVTAIDILIEYGISCLPIVDDGRLVGILTNTDLHILLQTLLQTARLTGAEHSLARSGR